MAAGYRIGIISDTHGLLRPEVAETLKGCGAILHGGDINRQEILDQLGQIAPVYAVRGNNDREWAEQIPETLTVTLGGLTFFMIHNRKMIAPGDGNGADVVIYGHSHRYEERCGDPLGGEEGRRGRPRQDTVCGTGRPRQDTVCGTGQQRQDTGGGAGQLWLNPGSCGPRRFAQPITMAVMEIREDGSCQVERVDLSHKGGILGRRATARRSAASSGGVWTEAGSAGGVWTEAGSTGGVWTGETGEAAASGGETADDAMKIPANIQELIPLVIKEMKRGRPVAEIAKRTGLSYELTEQICRLYVTHPGVDLDGILRRMGI